MDINTNSGHRMAKESDPIDTKRKSLEKTFKEMDSKSTDSRLQRAREANKQHVQLTSERVKVDKTAICIAPRDTAVIARMQQIRGNFFPESAAGDAPPAA